MISELLKNQVADHFGGGRRQPDDGSHISHICEEIRHSGYRALCILNDQGKVFLVRRDANDPDYPRRPYHMPGTVINGWDDIGKAIERLIAKETKTAGLEITKPEWIGCVECVKQPDNPRHSIGLLHVAHFHGKYDGSDDMGFFPIDEIPENTFTSHRLIIEKVKLYLKTGKPILGQ